LPVLRDGTGLSMQSRAAGGFAAAVVTVLIWAAYPVATRAGLTGSAAPDDLLAMRFGIGALCFLPYLLLRSRRIPERVWRAGLPLALFQGAGMAGLVIFGLQYAPASHSAALGPGASHAWVALFGLVFFSQMPAPRFVLGSMVTLCGIMLLIAGGGAKWNNAVLLGDAMFLAASALGATYVLRLRASGIAPFHGALVVTLYSALIVVPWYLYASGGLLARMTVAELLWQSLWQGVLIGFISLVTMNQAITRLGSERAAAMFALVPALGAVLGCVFLRELPTAAEWAGILAVSLGVAVATLSPRRVIPATA
jgi:drug/metabolite transporter (DMT)-like permease